MGSLFRSEEMTLCQLFLQSEAAYACVSELGELGLVQFRDLNPDVNAFQRKFVNEVRRCDEMERKLRYLEKEIKKDEIPMLDTGESPEAPQPREMIDLEATFEKLENELREVNQNAEALKRNFLELTELKHILRKTQVFFDEAVPTLSLTSSRYQQMADSHKEEEQVQLLGEEGVRSSQQGQNLKLGDATNSNFAEYRIPNVRRFGQEPRRGEALGRSAEHSAAEYSATLSTFRGRQVTTVATENVRSDEDRTADPYKWWSANAKQYPTLSQFAKIYLSSPGSSVYSERLFSEAGIIYEEKRNRLLSTNAEKIVFIHHNLPLQEGGLNTTTESMTRALITDETRTGHSMGPVQLGFVAGVILRERLPAFERMLWRACRGNVFLRQAMIEAPLEDPSNGDQVYKSVFIIFFQGDQLKTRVKKICEGFRATLYPCPEAPADRREMAMGVMTRIEDLNTVLGQTQDHRHRVLVAAAKNLKNWFVKVRKIKAIYHTLNLFNLDVTQKCLIAECWVPVLDIETIQLALRRGTERSGSSVPPILNRMQTFENPPTYNRTNKFTRAFQALIDAYGVATYREMNPAPYTIITFPFLFAVMFGDLGHGAIMALFGLWMILKEKPLAAKKTDNEIWNIFFGGRYIIFLMGVFSMYTGIIYNDIFSKSLNLFGSHWKINYNISTIMENKELQLDPNSTAYIKTPYPFGMDPVWQVAEGNKIIFQNAYKMKISIIFGVIHMIFGVIISYFNHRYFKNRISVIFEFIPQMIFLIFLFFYMVLLMFMKWTKYAADNDPPYSAGCAPSILITFINMVLFKPPNKALDGCDEYMYGGERYFEKLLVVLALLCIPWMLLGKPIYIMRQRKQQNIHPIAPVENGDAEAGINQDSMAQTEGGMGAGGPPGHEEENEMSEIFIHQGIHTIEYVLGSVSHTASYLRLWALSLAHAQLADVLWKMVLTIGLRQDGWFGGALLWIVFSIWAVLTVGILVLMEGLSAFLHTLRLHWVEFQSKFYSGQGYAFQPFSFEAILESGNAGTSEE